MKLKAHLEKAGKPCERCRGTGVVMRDPNLDGKLVRGTCGICAGSKLADYKARGKKRPKPMPVDERPLVKIANGDS